MIGSPIYTSPGFMHAEAGSGAPVNLAKADSYSVGATLYQILTGRAPVPAADDWVYADYSRHFARRVSKCLTPHGYPVVPSSGGACPERASPVRVEAAWLLASIA